MQTVQVAPIQGVTNVKTQASAGMGMKLDTVRGTQRLKMQASEANPKVPFLQADSAFTRSHCSLNPFPSTRKKAQYCPFQLM